MFSHKIQQLQPVSPTEFIPGDLNILDQPLIIHILNQVESLEIQFLYFRTDIGGIQEGGEAVNCPPMAEIDGKEEQGVLVLEKGFQRFRIFNDLLLSQMPSVNLNYFYFRIQELNPQQLHFKGMLGLVLILVHFLI